MGQIVRFREVLRRLAMVDESFLEDQAGLRLGSPSPRLPDLKTAALVRVGALAAIGAPGVCLEWSTTQALAAGLGRVVGAVTDVADALGYDVEAGLVDPDGH